MISVRLNVTQVYIMPIFLFLDVRNNKIDKSDVETQIELAHSFVIHQTYLPWL